MLRSAWTLLLSGALLTASACNKKEAKNTTPVTVPVAPEPWAPTTETFSRTGSPYTFKLINKSEMFTAATKKAMVDLFFDVYPMMVAYINPDAQKEVMVTIDPAYDGAAYASNGAIVIGAAFINDKPINIDVITHEVTHIIQFYKRSPHFMQEGLPDFVRHMIKTRSAETTWTIGPFNSQKYLYDGYTPASRFLIWVDNRIEKGIVLDADKTCRAGTYTPKFWWNRTGRSIEQLWDIYTRDPALDGTKTTLPAYVPVPGGQLSDGVYKITSKLSNLSLDVSGADISDNARLALWNYEEAPNQLMQFIHQGDGWYRVSPGHSAKVLDVLPVAGANVGQHPWTGSDKQLWKPVKNEDGSYHLINKQSGFAWEVSGSSGNAGAAIIQSAWTGMINQKWNFTQL